MNNNGKLSIIFASIALPAALLVSGTIAWYLKAHNPDNVDITAGLAYLRPILVSAFLTFGTFVAMALVSALRGMRKDSSKELSVLGLSLVVVVTFVSLAAGIANSGASRAEDVYRDKKTADFFKALDQKQ